jgi:hypothetical protein
MAFNPLSIMKKLKGPFRPVGFLFLLGILSLCPSAHAHLGASLRQLDQCSRVLVENFLLRSEASHKHVREELENRYAALLAKVKSESPAKVEEVVHAIEEVNSQSRNSMDFKLSNLKAARADIQTFITDFEAYESEDKELHKYLEEARWILANINEAIRSATVSHLLLSIRYWMLRGFLQPDQGFRKTAAEIARRVDDEIKSGRISSRILEKAKEEVAELQESVLE